MEYKCKLGGEKKEGRKRDETTYGRKE